MNSSIMPRPTKAYYLRKVAVPLTIGIIVLATNLRCMAQINASEVTRVPAISAPEVQRAFQDIYATPPTLPLTGKSPEAHRGNVWLRSTDEGLHIWGKVERGEQEIQWPRQRSEMLSPATTSRSGSRHRLTPPCPRSDGETSSE